MREAGSQQLKDGSNNNAFDQLSPDTKGARNEPPSNQTTCTSSKDLCSPAQGTSCYSSRLHALCCYQDRYSVGQRIEHRRVFRP